jgi:aryl-alcohol dehydrogenase-like predicted oxidoreductase
MKGGAMPDLARTMLGRTGLEVTKLGFGAMELRGPARGGPEVTEEESERILNAVLDAGINFIDTSPDYGLSEERIGRFIAHRRREYYLASKCGCAVEGFGNPGDHVYTAANVRAGVEQSLRRMQTDYLDVVQFHGSPSRAQLEEAGAVDELRKLQAEGKVRFLGMSGTLPDLHDHLAMGVFDEFQLPYSAIQREHERVIAEASEAGAGIAIRGGAARGTPTDWEHRSYYMMPGTMPRDRWEQAKLDELLDGMSRIEFTLRFTLSHPDLDTTIVGTKDVGHLQSNLEFAAKGPLPADVVAEAKRRLDEAGSRPE